MLMNPDPLNVHDMLPLPSEDVATYRVSHVLPTAGRPPCHRVDLIMRNTRILDPGIQLRTLRICTCQPSAPKRYICAAYMRGMQRPISSAAYYQLYVITHACVFGSDTRGIPPRNPCTLQINYSGLPVEHTAGTTEE